MNSKTNVPLAQLSVCFIVWRICVEISIYGQTWMIKGLFRFLLLQISTGWVLWVGLLIMFLQPWKIDLLKTGFTSLGAEYSTKCAFYIGCIEVIKYCGSPGDNTCLIIFFEMFSCFCMNMWYICLMQGERIRKRGDWGNWLIPSPMGNPLERDQSVWTSFRSEATVREEDALFRSGELRDNTIGMSGGICPSNKEQV